MTSISLFIFSEIKFISDYYSFPSRFWEFALGSIIYFFQTKKKLNFNILILIFILILSVSNFMISNEEVIIVFSVIFFYITLIYSRKLNNNFITRIFRFFGKISFSYYLWHLIFISFFKNSFDLIIVDFSFIFITTTIFSFLTYQFIEAKFNKNFYLDIYFKKIINTTFLVVPLFFSYVFLFNSSLINKSFNSLNKYSINFFHFVEKNTLSKKENNEIIVERYDRCENEFEIFSWSRKVNCITSHSDSNLVYLMGNSYGDHLLPLVSKVFDKSTIYSSRFENCFVSSKIDCSQNNLDIIVNQYLNISNNFKKKLILISLNNKNFSEKKMIKILNKLKKRNTEIIIVYPHPPVDVFSDKTKLREYNLIKNNDLKLLKNSLGIIVYDPFKYICSNCDPKSYENFFIEDGSHFNLNGSLYLIESFKEIYKY